MFPLIYFNKGEKMEEQPINKLFRNRLKESNIFTNEEIGLIEKNIILYERCYYLGIMDSSFNFMQ